MGLSPDDGPLIIVLLNSVYTTASDVDRLIDAVLDLIRNVESLAAQRGTAARCRFASYGYKTQRILEGYGEESLDELRAVSQK